MNFSNQSLVCEDCQRAFLWDAGEQAWYKLKGLSNPPKHCKDCRTQRRHRRLHQPRQYSKVNCADCGTSAYVPFVPKGIKPVYCSNCLSAQRA